jgi:(p)ppGpp synthase/HD superfamily hydrolase
MAGVIGHIQSAVVQARAKALASQWRKLRRLGCERGELDVLGVRVIVPTRSECYRVIEAVHAAFEPIPGEFDDYIRHPKPNGYMSLHTTVKGPRRTIVEVQVRTHQMHVRAERGDAGHTRYKASQVQRARTPDEAG